MVNYWLWVTKDGGMDDNDETGSFWIWEGCDSDTQEGDYALIYRISPYSHIKYLVGITSDAHITMENMDKLPDEVYSCDFEILSNFKNEVNIEDMRSKEELSDWHPLKISFQKMVFPIKEDYWKILEEMISTKNTF